MNASVVTGISGRSRTANRGIKLNVMTETAHKTMTAPQCISEVMMKSD